MPTSAIGVLFALAAPPLLGPIAPGPRPVSLEVIAERDTERGDRPLQIVLWRPSAGDAGEVPLTYGDYIALQLSEKDAAPVAASALADATEGYVGFLSGRGVPEAIARAWLAAPMLARRDAEAAHEPAPLVLVAQGNAQSAVDQAVLAELLASHGYAVATCPSPSNLSGPMRDESEIGPRAQEQAADLAFLLQRLADEPGIDARRVAVVSHSFGARGALLFAMREPAVRALVSLDGGIGTALGREALEAAPGFRADGLHVPVLHAYEELDAFMTPDFGLLRETAGARLELLPTRGMHHVHFTSLGFAAAAWSDLATATGAGPELGESLAAVVARSLDVLHQALTAEVPPD